VLVLVLVLVLSVGAALASATEHAAHHPTAAAPATDGEVRKIDKQQGKVTLQHGPIAILDMLAMTMVF
jgi:Cu(I)/Ag(I) efflux system periplasmic protein CusF